ncbi:MAG: LytTR family DNA-binding domain-containing protein [Clostridia bacterium]
MNLSVGICDDEIRQTEYIKKLVSVWAKEQNFSAQIKVFSSAENFLFEYEDCKNFDILLLDIEMGKINGVELAKEIRKKDEAVQIIFITGFSDFMAEGFEVSALHYLMKPVKMEKLFEVLNKAVAKISYKEKPVIIENTKILPSEIYYAESIGHKSKIVTKTETIEAKIPLNKLEEMLGTGFVKVHRSYLASINFIKTIGKTEIILDSGEEIPMSRRLYQDVNKAFIKHFRGEQDGTI